MIVNSRHKYRVMHIIEDYAPYNGRTYTEELAHYTTMEKAIERAERARRNPGCRGHLEVVKVNADGDMETLREFRFTA